MKNMRKIISSALAVVMVLGLTAIGAQAETKTSFASANFNNWSASTYYSSPWRVPGGSNSSIPANYSNEKVFGGNTNAFAMTGNGSYGYFNKAATLDATNKYFIISFDVALDDATSVMQLNLNKTSSTVFQINASGITATGANVAASAKRWYSVDIIEKYDGVSTAVWDAYIDGKKVTENVASVGLYTAINSGNALWFANKGGKVYLDNIDLSVADYLPIIAEDKITLSSSIGEVKNDFPRSITVRSDTTAAQLKNAISTDGLDSYKVVDALSTEISDASAAVGSYFVATEDGTDYIYPVNELLDYRYTTGIKNFDSWLSNYYGYGGWRVNTGTSMSMFENKAVFGAATNSVKNQSVGNYIFMNNDAKLKLEGSVNYFTISFDAALDNEDSSFNLKAQYAPNNLTSWSTMFEMNGSGIKCFGKSADSFSVTAKRWYSFDIVEKYNAANSLAAWDVYVDGKRVLENIAASPCTQINGNNFRFTNANSAFYFDNAELAVQNYAPVITEETVQLASSSKLYFVKNEFPRCVFAANNAKVEDIVRTLDASDFDSLTVRNSANTVITEGAAAGGYITVVKKAKEYIYPVSCGYIKDDFNTSSMKYVTRTQQGSTFTEGYTGGLFAKDENDLAYGFRDESYVKDEPYYTLNLNLASQVFYNGRLDAPQVYSFDIAVTGAIRTLNWLIRIDGTNYFPVQFYDGSIGSFGTPGAAYVKRDQWNKFTMVMYPTERKIDVYANGALAKSTIIPGTGNLVIDSDNPSRFRFWPEFTDNAEGQSFSYMFDNFEYYIGEPSFVQSEMPGAAFTGYSVQNSIDTNYVNEVIVNGAFDEDCVTSVNGSAVKTYQDGEGVTTVVAVGLNGIYKYYKVTEISPITVTDGADGSKLASVTVKESSQLRRNPVLVLSAYSADNALTGISTSNEAGANNTLTATLTPESGSSVKAMLFESLRNLLPLTQNYGK